MTGPNTGPNTGPITGRVTQRCLRLAAGLLAACALTACNTPFNLLAALDGPYISPERRAEIAYRQAQERQALVAPVVAPTSSARAAPAAVVVATAPLPTSAPAPAVVAPPAPMPTPTPTAAPAPASVAAPPPVVVAPASPISPSAGLMGLVVTRESAAAPPATRLPSAFDLTPAPTDSVRRRPVPTAPAPSPAPAEPPALAQAPASAAPAPPPRDLQRAAAAAGFAVVGALPAPAAAPATGSPDMRGDAQLRAFYDFALERLDAAPAAGGRLSMLLADPPSLDPELKRCGNLPPAVLVDVDPGNGLLPLVSDDTGNPELARYLGLLRARGVTVFWISGHGPGQASQIRQRLVASGLDQAGADPLIVTRFAGESKQARRYSLGETNCVLAMLGDQRGDFDELYDFVLDPIMAAPLEEHVNHGWFLAPAPLD
ncbi:MAG: hypothetical protein ABIT10_13010 [Alteraurantiacibacter sp.]